MDYRVLITPIKWLRIEMIILWSYRMRISKRFFKLNVKNILNGMLSFYIWYLMCEMRESAICASKKKIFHAKTTKILERYFRNRERVACYITRS